MKNKTHKLRLEWQKMGNPFELELYGFYKFKAKLIIDIRDYWKDSHFLIQAVFEGRCIGNFDSAYEAELAIIKKARSKFKSCLNKLKLKKEAKYAKSK